MRLVDVNHFPTHPELIHTELVLSTAERSTLMRAVKIIENARELVGYESDEGMDWGTAEAALRSQLDSWH